MFAPLALTQALPFLPLAQGDIDYGVDERADPGLIGRTLREEGTKVVLVRGGLLGVPHGHGRPGRQGRMRLATLPGAYVERELGAHPEVTAIYLGSYATPRTERVVALDLSRVGRQSLEQAVDESAIAADDAFDATSGPATGRAPGSLFDSAVDRFDWVDLRAFVPHASAREVGQATTMVSLANWYAYQAHCPHCGAPTRSAMSGWAQRCTNDDDGNPLLFPRVEPAVIMAVVDSQDRLLLQHNRSWKNPVFHSVSAGFVEAGENLEHACRRETMEETGIRVGEVRYLGSQPWPYRISLMMAFKGQALDTDIHVDGQEVVSAQWVSRDELTGMLAAGELELPGRATIARYMIEEWYGREL
ncbi:NAD(+) diphosphatase [Bifidobacterium cuniculi]|uniref:NAD(+) diphosphatase n=1 Tax=Bifidobacterium cuniculi TaxID=1688 RepID=A0A087ARP6_9BIFI|nr:NAD(+) diphosphatase [Bifidobacterium cuniculi]KFI61446.1 phosphohydrolase [Bifidobacterium cuniculi]